MKIIIILFFITLQLQSYYDDLYVTPENKNNNVYIHYSNKLLFYNAIGFGIHTDSVEVKLEIPFIDDEVLPVYTIGLNLYPDDSLGFANNILFFIYYPILYSVGLIWKFKPDEHFHISLEAGALVMFNAVCSCEGCRNIYLPYLGINLIFPFSSW